MSFSNGRACARLVAAVAGVQLWCAAGLTPAWAADAGIGPLTLAETIRLALDQQPALASEAATSRALRQDAVAEGQLPDPQLISGIMQMPVTNDAAFSLRDDDFTALSVGLMQEIPRGAKRQLLATRMEQQAAATEIALTGTGRRIRRDAAAAYLDVLGAGIAAKLVDDLTVEAQRQRAIAETGLRTGQSTLSDVLAAAVDVETLADRSRAWRQRELAARVQLARWIGPAADRPFPESLPFLPDPEPLDHLLAALPEHPLLAESAAVTGIAVTDLKLAEAGSKPDWRVELRYDHRVEFPDLVTVMVGVDLPMFTGQRQDRRTAAARERLQATRARRDDAQREVVAALTTAHHNWQAGTERLHRYDEVLLPASRERVAAVMAAYRSARGPLFPLLEARRSVLEAELLRLDLYLAVMRERLALQYFEMEDRP